VIHRAAEWLLPIFGAAQRPAAWLLLIGGAVTFVAVLTNLIATGTAKWATLLVAADLIVSGLGNVQTAEQDADDDRAMS
jgi:uncharacterized membrane protein HdeD (DUF308 family)